MDFWTIFLSNAYIMAAVIVMQCSNHVFWLIGMEKKKIGFGYRKHTAF